MLAERVVRIRGILGEGGDADSFSDDRASLTYGLGAALIWAGDRAEAKRVLDRGFRIAVSDYWRMRIANALVAASKYAGEFQSALEWADRAIQYANRAGADEFKPRILANRAGILNVLGRLSESAEQDLESASWAQRMGNFYEYAAGLNGASINHLYLARYEESLDEATRARLAAERVSDRHDIGKAYELEGLARFCLGQLDGAESSVRSARRALQDLEYVDASPRVDWLAAKIFLARGDVAGGLGLLESAEKGLRLTGDLEDLWGVQVELHLARARNEGAQTSLQIIREITAQAGRRGILVAQVFGALAIGEIITDSVVDDGDFDRVLSEALSVAEGAGMLEYGWRLSFRIGQLAASRGDAKESRVHYSLAIRVLRQIAGQLSQQNRQVYLSQPHIRSAMESMSQLGGPRPN